MHPARFAIFVSALALAACADDPIPASGAPESDIAVYARNVLSDLQPLSFAHQQEMCGYIYVAADGSLRHTTPRPGDAVSCDYGVAPRGALASFHTHGHYVAGYDSEIPSIEDALGSTQSALDDYLSTPGGRFWIIRANGVSDLLCGEGCLESDPNYRDDPLLPVDNRYTVSDLRHLSG